MGPDTTGFSCPRCVVAKRAYSGVSGVVGLAGAGEYECEYEFEGERGAGAETTGWECGCEAEGEDVDVVRLRSSCFIPPAVVQECNAMSGSLRGREKERGGEGGEGDTTQGRGAGSA